MELKWKEWPMNENDDDDVESILGGTFSILKLFISVLNIRCLACW